MAKYRLFIQDNFLIDDAKSGKLVPFKFNSVQQKFYNELVAQGIEERGIQQPVREIILKARREGFTSLILALFAADDILSKNPTESLVISYKHDSTKTFIKRYKNFVMSYYAKRWNEKRENNVFKIDTSGEVVHAENGARFYCGTASARIGGRGGTVHKLLFSEAAFYPDKQELRASEIMEGTTRQVDVGSGFVFIESTANGENNYYAKVWREAEKGESRFKPRFYGWREFYTQEQYDMITSEITDKRLVKQEFPATAQEAFLSSGNKFFDPDIAFKLVVQDPVVQGDWKFYEDYKPGHRYALGADVAEGVGRHNSTIVIIDFDAQLKIEGRLFTKPKVVGVYANNKIAPDMFAHEIASGATRFGNCIACPERNNHGFATITKLKDIYFNLYHDEQDKLGWQTNYASKPKMMHDLRTAIHDNLIDISDDALKKEIVNYPHQDLNKPKVDEEDESGGHYDRVIALAIAWQMNTRAVPSMIRSHVDEEYRQFSSNLDMDRYSPISSNF